MKRIIIGIGFIIFIVLGGKYESEAKEIEEGNETVDLYYDSFKESAGIEELEEELNAVNRKYGKEETLSFADIFSLLLEGKVEEAIEEAARGFYQNISNEILRNRALLLKLLALVIIAAIFNNYSSVFKFSFLGEQGFYITYLMIAVLLLQSFTLAYDIAEETIFYLKDIVECMLPALFMSLVLCTGLATSQMVNSMFLWMLSFIEKVLLNVVLPAVRIYFLIVVLNQLNVKDRFSKLATLLKQGIQFLLKAMVTGIIGLNIMKSMLVPVYENAKYSALQKGLSIIPGGSAVTGLSTILLGAGVLIKNSVGVTFVIILLVLGSIPLLKLSCFYVVYRLILAFVQPISDNRILAGIQGAADSTGILVRASATSIILSVLSIAIVILTTNVKLYAG